MPVTDILTERIDKFDIFRFPGCIFYLFAL